MPRLPAFCPNEECSVHHGVETRSKAFVRNGSHRTAAFGRVQRFRCRECGRSFSTQTMSIDYYAKRRVCYRRLRRAVSECVSVRAVGRVLGISPATADNRIMRAARAALWQHAQLDAHVRLEEDVAADGFESYWVSKYFPNNISIVAGSHSRYLYAFDAATIRRKGAMSEAQVRRREQLERRWRADPAGVEKSFARLLESMIRLHAESSRVHLTLFTDEKYDYLRALSACGVIVHWRQHERFSHIRISSKAPRNKDNPLFPVNYFDREFRKDLHEHTRKTVCFARNANLQMERMAIYAAEHNVAKPYLINQPAAAHQTHATIAGIPAEVVASVRYGLYRRRAFYTRVSLPGWADRIWRREYDTPLKARPEYRPGYLTRGIPYPQTRQTVSDGGQHREVPR
ncbi:MAG: transposase [bacterium]